MNETPLNKEQRFSHLKLRLLPRDYKYVLFADKSSFWENASQLMSLPEDELYFLFQCGSESSMIVPSRLKLQTIKEEADWKAVRIVGEMPFGTVQGLIASISGQLQKGNIGICVISTFLTDVFFIKAKNIEAAAIALKNEGWEFIS